MSLHDTKKPIGGVNTQRVIERPDPNDHLWLKDQGLLSVKELWVGIHYPTTVR